LESVDPLEEVKLSEMRILRNIELASRYDPDALNGVTASSYILLASANHGIALWFASLTTLPKSGFARSPKKIYESSRTLKNYQRQSPLLIN
jgi:hypothetical protein